MFAPILGLTCRMFLLHGSVTHGSALPRLVPVLFEPGLVGAPLLGTVVNVDIGPIRFALGHVITSFFGTTPL